MVLGDPQAHFQRHIIEQVSVKGAVCAGNHHIAPAAEHGFKHAPPENGAFSLLNMPAGEQDFIIDKPAAVAHRIGRGLPGSACGHGSGVHAAGRKPHPPGQREDLQPFFGYGQERIDSAEIIPAPETEFVLLHMRGKAEINQK